MSYATGRLWQHRMLRRHYARSKGAIVVHQMSKVGSQTVVASLHEALPDHAIYHTHFISDQGLAWLEGFVRERWGSVHIPQHLWHGQFVRGNLCDAAAPERLRVVTLVRDPVARNISEFSRNWMCIWRIPINRNWLRKALRVSPTISNPCC
jgi:hypothetical protein